MSRHRIVRRMNYEDEYCDDYDDYGQSYEDRYCVSPSTAAEFMYNREQNFDLSSYMEEEIPEESEIDLEPKEAQAATAVSTYAALSDIDKGQLQSCVEEIHSVMGDSIADSVLTETVVRHKYNTAAALDELLSLSGTPKPQRTPRKKDRMQGDDEDIEDLLSEINALDQQDNLYYKGTGGIFKFQKGMLPSGGISLSKRGEIDQGNVCDVGSSSRSVGSGSCLSFRGLTLSEMAKGSDRSKGHSGVVDSGSDTSSPLQVTSPPQTSLMTSVQQYQACEQSSSAAGGMVSKHIMVNIGNLQERPPVSWQPHTVLPSALTQKELSKSSDVSLCDLIRAQENSAQAPPTQTSTGFLLASRELEQKSSDGLSVNKLIAQNKQSPSSSTPSSSFSAVSSSPQASKGLSLTELISLHSSQQKLETLGRKSGQTDSETSSSKNSLSVQDMSVSQLIMNESKSKEQFSSQAASSNIPSSSLGSLAKSSTYSWGMTAGHARSDRKTVSAQTVYSGSGLSLSDFIKQHQSRGNRSISSSQLVSAPTQDINANSKQTEESSNLVDRFKHDLSFRSEGLRGKQETYDTHRTAVQHAAMGSQGQVVLSLADCLKKKTTIHPKHSNSALLPAVSDNVEEKESPLLPLRSGNFEADCFDPIKVDFTVKKTPSLFARCICLHLAGKENMDLSSVQKSPERNTSFPKFQFKYQIRHMQVYAEAPLQKVVPFDFSSPSPDDIVKERQSAAFTHTGHKWVSPHS